MKSMSECLRPITWLARHPIARRQPVRTARRWLYWQVRQVFTSQPKVMPFVGGTRLQVYPHEGLTGYWYVTLPEFEELTFLLRFLQQGDVFYDVGANAGAFSILALSRGCVVIAMEPVPHSFVQLQANASLNDSHGTIIALSMAAGAKAGRLRISTHLGTGNHIVDDREAVPKTDVEAIQLDTLGERYQWPTFVKIDVEGHELEVIRGSARLLENPALLGLLIETFRPHNWQTQKLRALEALLAVQGFRPYEYLPNENKVRCLSEPEGGSNNTFYFRDSRVVQQRLDNAAEPRSVDGCV